MKPTHSLRTYLVFGLLAACGYLILMGVFLSGHRFESLWMLPIGNVIYLFSVGIITAYFYSRNHFQDSSISNATAGHYVSFTGAAIATVVTLSLFFVFRNSVWPSGSSTGLTDAPGSFPTSSVGGILPIVLVDAAFGNTVCGFFAAILISFSAKRNQRSEVSK